MGTSLLDRALDRTAALLRGVVPPRIWNRLTAPYRDWRFARDSRRGWLTRQDRDDGHVEVYWSSADHPNRTRLVEIVAGCVEEHDRAVPLRILEFGCHAGMNFRLLHDRFPDRAIRYFGVEPNHDAAAFLRGKLPFVELLEAEDGAFVDGEFPPGAGTQISFINVVLYTVHATRAKKVIAKLCRTSEVVILGELLENVGATTEFVDDPAMYAHPYASWLRELGFSRQEILPAPDPRPQLSGFLVARRR